MRTLTISHSNWFLRFFVWMWEVDPKKLNICKLFWGTALLPLSAYTRDNLGEFAIRVSISCAIVAALCAIFHHYGLAIVFFADGAAFAILSAFYYYRTKGKAKGDSKAAKDRTLTKISGNGSAVFEWIMDHTLGYALDAYFHIADSNSSKRLKGPLSVAVEYIRSAKHHLCPLIKVE